MNQSNLMHKRNKCSRFFVKMDYFGQPFNFVLPDNSTKLRSVPGAICWLIMITIMIGFATYRFEVLVSQSHYRTVHETFEYYFDENDKIGRKDNFAIAAAVTSFDGSESIEDE